MITKINLKSWIQWIGLIAGPLLAFLLYSQLPSSYTNSDSIVVTFSTGGRVTAALAVWMAVWWMTEAVDLYATALLPLVVLPMSGAAPIRTVAAPYAHELIFLFMGGFIIALAMQRWGLHRRFALKAMTVAGDQPVSIVGCSMGVTAFLSMWVSNTATTLMMLPIALSIIGVVDRQRIDATSSEADTRVSSNFSLCLLLGIAYSASIGGIGTIIGTPPNVFLVSFIQSSLGQEISFVRWMSIGVPLVLIFVPLAWLMLTKVIYPVLTQPIEGSGAATKAAYQKLGHMSRGERFVLVVFLLAAAAWVSRPMLARLQIGDFQPAMGLTDPVIAMIAALILFVIPVDVKKRVFVMNWETAVKIPWGLLLLFGGGLSLASAIGSNGVAEFIGNQLGVLAGIPTILLVMAVIALVIFLTELTSNTATTATLIPILAALSTVFEVHVFMLIVPAAIAASCAFMLPVATPPNAIVFGSGHVTIHQMVRAGLWLNLIGIVLITVLVYTMMMWILKL